MSYKIKLPGSRLVYKNGELHQSTGCCPHATGDVGSVGTVAVLAGIGFGLMLLFPRAWKGFTKSLWG